MDPATRNSLQNATQQARRLLEREISEQLEGTFDVLPNGTIADKPGKHLDASQRLVRTKIVESIRHRAGGSAKADMLADAVADYVREAAFTTLNRYIALKMLEVRGLAQQCITKGDQSSGFKEFGLAATGLAQLPDKGYRLYLESLFDELSTEVKILFDRHSDASLLWPRRQAFDGLLEILNADDLGSVWNEDETIGWVYQYFNSQEERRAMRDASQAPRNSRELAVRNQFFTPRYVVEFLTDNTLGRTWYEMRQGVTALAEKCRYLVRRPDEVFLSSATVAGDKDLEGPSLFAKFLADPSSGSLLPFSESQPQPMIELAHCVDAYARHPFGQEVEGQWWPWHTKVQMAAAESFKAFTTQDILDVMFCQCRADRHGGGDGIADPLFARLANEVRQRVLDTREPDQSQEELSRKPVFVAHRPKKDPRDLKILDPACGSSHFLIYCFDLLLTIYEEGWDDEASPASQVTGQVLKHDYPTIELLRAAVPGLILRHNLHGIDIDARCAQIGAFALWMRAQRAYNDVKIPKDNRPPITKSNIVVAEPMPGEDDLLNEFLRGLREDRLESLIREALNVPLDKKVTATKVMADSLCDLVRTIWDQMKLAGEAGSLLRIDSALEEAISTSRSEWHGRHALFRDAEFSLSEAQRDFWAGAESLVLHALRLFAQNVGQTAAASFRRGLFAEDAARGLAFIDVCRHRVDVALMNPPFGRILDSSSSKSYLKREYPDTWTDYYNAFISCGKGRLATAGYLGAIVPDQLLYAKKSASLRNDLLSAWPLRYLADIGPEVMDDAAVSAVAFVAGGTDEVGMFGAADLRGKAIDSRPDALIAWCRLPSSWWQPSVFRSLPQCAIAHRADRHLVQAWCSGRRLDPDYATVATGGKTFDDFRFLRLWWEVPPDEVDVSWRRVDTGGSYQQWLAPTRFVQRWSSNGAEVRQYALSRHGTDAQVMQSSKHWWKPALSYPLTSSIGFGPRVFAANTILSADSILVSPHDSGDRLPILAALCSSWAETLLLVFGDHRRSENSTVKAMPLYLNPNSRDILSALALKAIRAVQEIEEGTPFSPMFQTFQSRERRAQLAHVLVSVLHQVDEAAACVFGLGSHSELKCDMAPNVSHYAAVPSTEEWRKELLQYALSRVLGFWQPQPHKGGPSTRESDPFAALPALPPAWNAGIHLSEAKLTDRHLVLDVQKELLAILEECDLRHDEPALAEWLTQEEPLQAIIAKSVFAWHVRQTSTGPRKAPVLWQLSSRNSACSIWVNYHALSTDTLFVGANQLLAPELDRERAYLSRLRSDGGASPTTRQRQLIEAQEERASEIEEFRRELLQVAPLFSPSLDDGVLINCAVLWRMFSQHKPWQSECRKCWEELSAGDYDWALLAMRLWPERVVPKCQYDRSMAIAHGLGGMFWVEAAGRWRALRVPREEIEEQQRIRKGEASERLLKAMMALAKSNHAAMPSRKLWKGLEQGSYDDQQLALCLWPERVITKAAPDVAIASRLEIKAADLATARARAALTAKYEFAELPSVLAAAEAAFGDDRDFKSLWAALAGGQHDGQPLALVLWPERVIEKCLKDVELADTHGLRDFFWVQDLATQQWRRRLAPEDEVKQEVQRRFNRTVKDALAKFIEAPTAEGASSRRRRGSAAAAEVGAGARPTTQGKKRGRPRTVNTEEELF